MAIMVLSISANAVSFILNILKTLEHFDISGEDGSCVSSNVPNIGCNCDANDPVWMSDAGIITSMDKLPITAFSYGPLEYEIERANITIGRLKCQGKIH